MTAETTLRTCAGCGTRLSAYNDTMTCGPCARREVEPAAPDAPPWLWINSRRAAPPDGSDLGRILEKWREANGLTQAELAKRLGWSQPYISQIENGKTIVRSVEKLRHIHDALGISTAELGLVADPEAIPSGGIGLVPAEADERAVVNSQRDWRATQVRLGRDRARLADMAADLYQDAIRIAGSAVISRPAWLPERPVPLGDVTLDWLPSVPRQAIDGTESATEGVRPLAGTSARFPRYSRAVRELDRPKLFENRPCYRLVAVEEGPRLSFGYTSYFESVVDTNAAIAHEHARAAANGTPGWSALPFRSLVDDPFDLTKRALAPSINTLTIRRDGARTTCLLHYRDAAAVATVAGSCHVVPAGMFQPSSIAPARQAADFDLWHNVMREFAEELLDLPEADGSSPDPIDYAATEPFGAMETARRSGGFQVWYYGIGLNGLSLDGEILTVAVIDAPVFDQIFGALSATNAEGSLVSADRRNPTAGIPFTQATLDRLVEHPKPGTPSLAPPAVALLRLAWRDRNLLLG